MTALGISVTFKEDLDRTVQALQAKKQLWAELGVGERLEILRDVRERVIQISDQWIEEDVKARRVTAGGWDRHTSVTTGPLFSLRLLRLYIKSLIAISKYGRPGIPGPIKHVGKDQISLTVYPADIYDRFILRDCTGEIWLETGYSESDLPKLQALAYQPGGERIGKVGLILGAGNVSGISISNILYKMLVANQVIIFKVHPVISYMKDILSYVFHEWIQRGFLSIISGSIKEAEYLCVHPCIEEIHVTGSCNNFDAISSLLRERVAGQKRITAELGNVTPVIIVPGPWHEDDVFYQAESLSSGLTVNSGFNCTANRIIIQHSTSPFRDALLNKMKEIFSRLPPSVAYYPGSEKAIRDVIQRNPKAICLGQFSSGRTPWTMVTHMDPAAKDEFFFRNEVYGSFIAETSFPGRNASEFLNNAVDFCNSTLWGTLSCQIVVHPKTLEEEGFREELEKAVAGLRYGTISINHFAGVGFFMGCLPWGGYPGSTMDDIQSGIGVVNNPYMLEKVQKSVIRGPFRLTPKPYWFPMRPRSYEIALKFLEFEKNRTFGSFLQLVGSAYFRR